MSRRGNHLRPPKERDENVRNGKRNTRSDAFGRFRSDFPEGTTSNGQQLLPFKTGGFEAVAGMQDGYIVPMYFHVRTINGQRVTTETRETVTWSNPQGMFANIWHLLGLGTLHFVIRIGEPIPASGGNRKELARSAQEAVQQLMDEEIAEL